MIEMAKASEFSGQKFTMNNPGWAAEELTKVIEDLNLDRVSLSPIGKSNQSPKDWTYGLGYDMTEDGIVAEAAADGNPKR